MTESRGAYRYLTPETVARFRNMNLAARSVVEGFVSGLHKSPFHGFSVEFAEHREYTPGDNIKYIDWMALARTDRYYVKQFEEETNLRCHLLLDVSGSMGYASSGALTKFEYGCYLAGALAYLMVRQQDSVGLVTFDNEIVAHIPPRATMSHLNVVLRALEDTTPGSVTRVGNIFHHLAETLKRRGLIIILSDLYDDRREVMRALRHFKHKHHEVIIFHLFDRAELEFPFERLTQFIDMETRQKLQVDPRYVRDEYRRHLDAFINDYRRDCSESHIEYVVTDTSVPFDLMLTAYLSRRKRYG
ncbi:MAG TPA: DUF58 domain-containing protein [Planctomycetota bacterium]|nr:DUF58 domain-containing protein [Planctomycetota bacterium]